MTMASAVEVDENISSKFYPSVAVRPVFESTLNEQLWWMYPITKLFGHACSLWYVGSSSNYVASYYINT